MITPEGGRKIADFGIARMPLERNPHADRRDQGSPKYISPEQVVENARSSLGYFSLGVIPTKRDRLHPFNGEA